MKKLLILGVIALFIGLAFIPSFNAVSISKDIEKINTVVDNTKEDCFECQSNGKTHLAEKLLNRLEKNEVLSKVIKSINPKDDRLICEILWNIYERYTAIADYYYEKKEDYELGTFWYNIYLYIFTIYFMISAIPIIIGAAVFGCWGPYPY